jgi:hypothetical protein
MTQRQPTWLLEGYDLQLGSINQMGTVALHSEPAFPSAIPSLSLPVIALQTTQE